MDELPIPTRSLWVAGYGAWPVSVRAERLVAALLQRGVTRLVDVRLNPSASDVKPGRYGPKPWTLQPGRSGIVGLLEAAGIAYEWLVELGNPQRHDPMMSVLRGTWPILRAAGPCIEDSTGWPHWWNDLESRSPCSAPAPMSGHAIGRVIAQRWPRATSTAG